MWARPGKGLEERGPEKEVRALGLTCPGLQLSPPAGASQKGSQHPTWALTPWYSPTLVICLSWSEGRKHMLHRPQCQSLTPSAWPQRPLSVSPAQGHFCPLGSMRPSLCPHGEHQPALGSDACLPCPAGFYCPHPGTRGPQLCPAHAYCPAGIWGGSLSLPLPHSFHEVLPFTLGPGMASVQSTPVSSSFCMTIIWVPPTSQ